MAGDIAGHSDVLIHPWKAGYRLDGGRRRVKECDQRDDIRGHPHVGHPARHKLRHGEGDNDGDRDVPDHRERRNEPPVAQLADLGALQCDQPQHDRCDQGKPWGRRDDQRARPQPRGTGPRVRRVTAGHGLACAFGPVCPGPRQPSGRSADAAEGEQHHPERARMPEPRLDHDQCGERLDDYARDDRQGKSRGRIGAGQPPSQHPARDQYEADRGAGHPSRAAHVEPDQHGGNGRKHGKGAAESNTRPARGAGGSGGSARHHDTLLTVAPGRGAPVICSVRQGRHLLPILVAKSFI